MIDGHSSAAAATVMDTKNNNSGTGQVGGNPTATLVVSSGAAGSNVAGTLAGATVHVAAASATASGTSSASLIQRVFAGDKDKAVEDELYGKVLSQSPEGSVPSSVETSTAAAKAQQQTAPRPVGKLSHGFGGGFGSPASILGGARVQPQQGKQ